MASEARKVAFAWAGVATLLFGLATAELYWDALEAGMRDAIPSHLTFGSTPFFVRSDHQFVVWAVSRNARTLATQPARLFDAEQCFPDERTLALGEPVIAMGVLGIPVWLATEDPILTYNAVLLMMSMFAALAMYWLIVQWTGVPAAGIAAGLVYAFQGMAIADSVHPYSADTTWAVLALAFAHRLFAHGRWRDALGLAAATSMQIATSFYPFVAFVLVALPFTVWLFVRHRLRSVRLLQLGLVVAVAGVVGLFVFGPYVAMEDAGVLAGRTLQRFRPWAEYVPGGRASFGWPASLLVLAGVLLPRRFCVNTTLGEPRIAFVCGGLLVAAVAAGPTGVWVPGGNIDLYGVLAALAPGFESVRIPWKMSIGVHLVFSVLAGFGAAGLISAWRWRGRTAAAAVLVAGVFVASSIGSGRVNQSVFFVRPPPREVNFYAKLAALGNVGPIFETPIPPSEDGLLWSATASQLLLSAYHHRPTSACYPSHVPPHQPELDAIEYALPSRDAVRALGRLGFTTIVLRHKQAGGDAKGTPARSKRGEGFSALASGRRAPLRLVHETPGASAYEIVP